MSMQRLFFAGVAVVALGLIAGRAAWAQQGGREPAKDKPKVDREIKPDEPPPSRRDGQSPRAADAGAGQRPSRWREGAPDRRNPRDGEDTRGGEGPRNEAAPGQGARPPMGPMGPMAPGGEANRAFGMMRGHGFGQPNFEEMAKRDPEMAKLIRHEMELDGQTRELAQKYRSASSAEQEAIKAKLKEVVKEQFENRQQRRQMELERLEKELKRLREAIEARKKAADELITRRLNELLGQPDDAGF